MLFLDWQQEATSWKGKTSVFHPDLCLGSNVWSKPGRQLNSQRNQQQNRNSSGWTARSIYIHEKQQLTFWLTLSLHTNSTCISVDCKDILSCFSKLSLNLLASKNTAKISGFLQRVKKSQGFWTSVYPSRLASIVIFIYLLLSPTLYQFRMIIS